MIHCFKIEYGINKHLCKQLSKYGIIALYISCSVLKNTKDFKGKYEINGDNSCDSLLNDYVQVQFERS